jgi:hypothetical protein
MGKRITLVVPGLGGITESKSIQGIFILSSTSEGDSTPEWIVKFICCFLISTLLKVVTTLLIVRQPEIEPRATGRNLR